MGSLLLVIIRMWITHGFFFVTDNEAICLGYFCTYIAYFFVPDGDARWASSVLFGRGRGHISSLVFLFLRC